VEVLDVEPARRLPSHGELGDVPRLVRRIVKDLDLQLVFRVVDRADRLDQPIHDVHLVVDRQLDRDDGPLVDRRRRTGRPILVFHVLVDQVIPVPPVNPENAEDEEVGEENERVEGHHKMKDRRLGTIRNSRYGVSAESNENP
jgi:hypothetical protein